MKRILLTTALSLTLAAPAFAGSIMAFEPQEAAVVAPAVQATDWSGLYVGGMASIDTGELGEDWGKGPRYYDLEGNMFGGFVGYNVQNGSFVYGGELALSLGSLDMVNETDYGFTQFIDVKARLGYAVGEALFYGVVGASSGAYDDNGADITLTGINYGIGMDYLLTDKMFVGLEYLVRDIESDGTTTPNMEADTQSIVARLGYKF